MLLKLQGEERADRIQGRLDVNKVKRKLFPNDPRTLRMVNLRGRDSYVATNEPHLNEIGDVSVEMTNLPRPNIGSGTKRRKGKKKSSSKRKPKPRSLAQRVSQAKSQGTCMSARAVLMSSRFARAQGSMCVCTYATSWMIRVYRRSAASSPTQHGCAIRWWWCDRQ